MKVFSLFSITFILMACLLVGCGGDDDDDDDVIGPDGGEGLFLGLTSMAAGSWAEHTDSDDNRFRMEYHGTDTYNGRESYVVEFEVDSDSGTVVSQIWIEKATGESILYVIKQGELLMRLDVSQVPEVAAGAAASEEDQASTSEKIGVETYTTPTGKSVQATVYRQDGEDIWISSEVPFGMVKSGSTSLYDFGSSGAQRNISRAEAENAEEFGFPDLDDLLDL